MPKEPENSGSFQRVGECLYRYAPNGVYYAVVRHQGKLIRRSLKTADRGVARDKLTVFKRSLGKIDFSAGKLTVGELLERYRQSIQYLAEKTIATRTGFAKRFEETWPGGLEQQVKDVRASEVKKWLGIHSGRISNATANEYLRFARQLFELAVKDRFIAENPAAEIRSLRRETPIRITPNWDQFLAVVRDIRSQRFNADAEDSANFVEFLGLTGLGNSEAADLRWKHIDFERNRITVLRNKTDTGFQIPIFPQVKELLHKLHAVGPLNVEANVFRIRDAKKAITAACNRLGLPHFSHRAFRRCFITKAVEQGIDFKTIAAWQGHRDGGVLIAKTYSHLRSEHSDEMAKRMNLPSTVATTPNGPTGQNVDRSAP